MTNNPTNLATLLTSATELQAVADEYGLTTLQGMPAFEQAFKMAEGIQILRERITPQMMKSVMALQNTKLGFRTDRDPRQFDQKTGRNYIPYAEDVVKECFIEATLKGLYAVGNEFNIISYNVYATREGLSRKVRQFPDLTDLTLSPEVPRTANGGAIVVYKATWKLKGQPQEIIRQIPVKVNNFMGADAILGKAERKILYAVWNKLTGSEIGEGEVEVMVDAPRASIFVSGGGEVKTASIIGAGVVAPLPNTFNPLSDTGADAAGTDAEPKEVTPPAPGYPKLATGQGMTDVAMSSGGGRMSYQEGTTQGEPPCLKTPETNGTSTSEKQQQPEGTESPSAQKTPDTPAAPSATPSAAAESASAAKPPSTPKPPAKTSSPAKPKPEPFDPTTMPIGTPVMVRLPGNLSTANTRTTCVPYKFGTSWLVKVEGQTHTFDFKDIKLIPTTLPKPEKRPAAAAAVGSTTPPESQPMAPAQEQAPNPGTATPAPAAAAGETPPLPTDIMDIFKAVVAMRPAAMHEDAAWEQVEAHFNKGFPGGMGRKAWADVSAGGKKSHWESWHCEGFPWSQ